VEEDNAVPELIMQAPWVRIVTQAPTVKVTRQVADNTLLRVLAPRFKGAPCGPKNCGDAESEIDFLDLLFPDSTWNIFVNATNAFQTGTNKHGWVALTVSELKQVFAIFMGVVKLPSRNMYFDGPTAQPFCSNLMSYRRFYDIICNLHWMDNSNVTAAERATRNQANAWWTVDTFLTQLSALFMNYYTPYQHCDVDEQCISMKGRHRCRCYNPNKPEKWYFKVYALNCGMNSYLWNFYLYQGRDEDRPAGISATSYPVYKLTLPDPAHNLNYVIHIDNWFTNVHIAIVCRKRGIHINGVVKANIRGFDKELLLPKKGAAMKERGFHHQSRCISDGFQLWANSWMDSKPVNTLSSFPSYAVPVTRNSKDKDFRHIVYTMTQLSCVKLYNYGMGGTDQFDQRLSYYRTRVKTVKWAPRVLIHFFYCAVVNAYILRRESLQSVRGDTSTVLGFMQKLMYQLAGQQYPDATAEHVRQASARRTYRTTESVQLNSQLVDHRHYPLACATDPKHCRVCRMTTNYVCKHCKIGLCPKYRKGQKKSCWAIFHDKL
jgi:hypothetical protein